MNPDRISGSSNALDTRNADPSTEFITSRQYFSMAVEHFEGRGTGQWRLGCVASSACAVHLRTYRCAEKNDNIVCAPTTLSSSNRQTRAQSFSAQLNVQLITRSNSSCANARHNEFKARSARFALRDGCDAHRTLQFLDVQQLLGFALSPVMRYM